MIIGHGKVKYVSVVWLGSSNLIQATHTPGISMRCIPEIFAWKPLMGNNLRRETSRELMLESNQVSSEWRMNPHVIY